MLYSCIAATRRWKIPSSFQLCSGENLVDTGGRDWLLATRTLLRHTPFLVLPRLPWINYARYLHTKRPGKIKNTNSERGRHPPVAPPPPPSPQPLLTRPRASSLFLPALFSRPRGSAIYPAAVFPEAVATLSHYSAGPPIL